MSTCRRVPATWMAILVLGTTHSSCILCVVAIPTPSLGFGHQWASLPRTSANFHMFLLRFYDQRPGLLLVSINNDRHMDPIWVMPHWRTDLASYSLWRNCYSTRPLLICLFNFSAVLSCPPCKSFILDLLRRSMIGFDTTIHIVSSRSGSYFN